MSPWITGHRARTLVLILAVGTAVVACGSREPAPPTAPAGPAVAPAAPPTPVTVEQVASNTWSPEALEELLAPIALYPDPVLSQVLIASTNPQEVLDAGNWLVANEALEGKALDDAAAKVGFTPPIRALVQFPQTVDMMCMEMGWTTELGQAFVADQAGVLDAVQRLRKQAMEVGNLKTSDAMVVETTEQEGKEVVVLKPPQPDVVYVPTYHPQTAYAPAPAAAAPAAATTTTTTTTTEASGHSTGSMIATGVLAFGAGLLVSELLEDDDDDWDDDYYYPNYGHGGMPYYPPYPYRPAYGGGYYPSNGYNRPPNYNSGWQNNGTIIINNPGGSGGGGGYWDRYDNTGAGTNAKNYSPRSPITSANPTRTDLNALNQRQPRPMPADAKRPSPTATAPNWKGQSSYAGKSKAPTGVTRDSKSTGYRDATAKGTAPKVQGSYAGADRAKKSGQAASTTRDVQRPASTAKPATRPTGGSGDRGYGTSSAQRPTSTPQARTAARPSTDMQGGGRNTATSGANRGSADRAASQRGKQSMPQGARSKGGGDGGKRQGR